MKFTKLILDEDFNEGKINRDLWDFEIGFIRNHEPQYYTDRPENAYIEDGMLKIVTRREEYEGAHYTSASLNTMGKFSFCYGRAEMRAKLPYSKGLWPAFWMMGENFPEVDWPHCGEIDIMETTGTIREESDRELITTIHWQSKEKNDHDCVTGRYWMESGKFADAFHIFAVEWEETELRWYLDDTMVCRFEITEDMKGCFNKPHFILINTALADWNDDDRPDDEHTVLPQEYCIDYIRVYQ